MTFLDDYEARYKLQGVTIVRELLRRVSTDLLKRTGIDGLLRTVRSSTLVLNEGIHGFSVLKDFIVASSE